MEISLMAVQTLDPVRETAADTAPVVLSVRDLTVAYNGDNALEGASFDVRAGESIAVIGPNGAGKSTLFQAILGLLPVKAGSVTFGPIDPEHIGYVPQHEGINWDFPVTVRDAVMMGRTRKIGWLRHPSRAHWQAVDAALERVGLLEFGNRQVGELSGGQRRRVFIARALAQDAEMLVLDEPFSGVDVQAQASLMDVLDALHRDGMTLLLSTHDLDLAFRRFDQVMALRRHLIAFGTAETVSTTDILTQMYGGLSVWQDGKRVSVFVDEHGCHDH